MTSSKADAEDALIAFEAAFEAATTVHDDILAKRHELEELTDKLQADVEDLYARLNEMLANGYAEMSNVEQVREIISAKFGRLLRKSSERSEPITESNSSMEG